ncbi:MAG: hypothetical protein WBD27_19565 [Pyrinomonadaceae bacterium]
MKNNLILSSVGAILLVSVLGCSSINPFSGSDKPANSPADSRDKSLTDKAVDKTVGQSRIGVPECDEVMDAITEELNNSEDDFVTKAIKATILNRIADGIRQSVEENKSDTVELAKTCKEFKTQFAKYKEEEKNKQKQ